MGQDHAQGSQAEVVRGLVEEVLIKGEKDLSVDREIDIGRKIEIDTKIEMGHMRGIKGIHIGEGQNLEKGITTDREKNIDIDQGHDIILQVTSPFLKLYSYREKWKER